MQVIRLAGPATPTGTGYASVITPVIYEIADEQLVTLLADAGSWRYAQIDGCDR